MGMGYPKLQTAPRSIAKAWMSVRNGPVQGFLYENTCKHDSVKLVPGEYTFTGVSA